MPLPRYPDDVRWRGSQKHYLNISTVRSLFFVVYVILIGVESALIRSWKRSNSWGSRSYSPFDFWARHGPYLIIDVVLTLTMVVFLYRGKWHPVAALVTSLLAGLAWLAGLLTNVLIVYYSEFSFQRRELWESIAYAEGAMQALIALCYFGMMGCAAKAVSVWRKNRSGKSGTMSAEERAYELRTGTGQKPGVV